MNKRNRELLKKWAEERRDLNSDYLNITLWIMNNYSSNIEEEDICIIYDNLEANSEIIDIDTIGDYSEEDIERVSNHRFEWVKKQVEAGYMFLLDFYYIRPDGTTGHKDCQFLKFKSGYNAL